MSLYEIKGLTFAYPDIISERDDIYLDPCLNDINITTLIINENNVILNFFLFLLRFL